MWKEFLSKNKCLAFPTEKWHNDICEHENYGLRTPGENNFWNLKCQNSSHVVGKCIQIIFTID